MAARAEPGGGFQNDGFNHRMSEQAVTIERLEARLHSLELQVSQMSCYAATVLLFGFMSDGIFCVGHSPILLDPHSHLSSHMQLCRLG